MSWAQAKHRSQKKLPFLAMGPGKMGPRDGITKQSFQAGGYTWMGMLECRNNRRMGFDLRQKPLFLYSLMVPAGLK